MESINSLELNIKVELSIFHPEKLILTSKDFQWEGYIFKIKYLR